MKISRDVLNILDRSTTVRNVLSLPPGTLDRKLYVAVDKVLSAMGGKWNRSLKGHVFPVDIRPLLEQVLLAEEIEVPKDFGFFETQEELANFVIRLADIKPDMLILEPSAGRGALAIKAELVAGKNNVECYELLEANCGILREVFGNNLVHQKDFLSVVPCEIFDRVVMNPPFSTQQDVDHVAHATKFLKSSGKLVSIMSAGITFRTNKKTREFKSFIEDISKEWSMLENPGGSFKLSGTMVNTITLYLEKR